MYFNENDVIGSPLFDRGQLFQSNFQRYIIYWDEEKS